MDGRNRLSMACKGLVDLHGEKVHVGQIRKRIAIYCTSKDKGIAEVMKMLEGFGIITEVEPFLYKIDIPSEFKRL